MLHRENPRVSVTHADSQAPLFEASTGPPERGNPFRSDPELAPPYDFMGYDGENESLTLSRPDTNLECSSPSSSLPSRYLLHDDSS